MPLISVIMSVYSEPVEWMRQAIDSILNQTFTDFEFIIVNDNPQRLENVTLLDSYASEDKRIRVIHNEKNLGLPTSLNRALDIVMGKYVARMDADDISLPDRFQYQYDFLETHLEYGICGTYARFIDEHSKVGQKVRLGHTNDELKARLLFYSPFMHPSIMARSSLICRLKYDESFRVAQDVELWLRMSRETKFYNIPQYLIFYRVHSKNSKKRESRTLQIEILKRLANKRLEIFELVSGNECLRKLFVQFSVSQPTNRRQYDKEGVDKLFAILLNAYGNNHNMYNVLLKRYIFDILKYGLYGSFLNNPFIHKSLFSYLLQSTIYLSRSLCKL